MCSKGRTQDTDHANRLYKKSFKEQEIPSFFPVHSWIADIFARSQEQKYNRIQNHTITRANINSLIVVTRGK
jgi:hypothetical protein